MEKIYTIKYLGTFRARYSRRDELEALGKYLHLELGYTFWTLLNNSGAMITIRTRNGSINEYKVELR